MKLAAPVFGPVRSRRLGLSLGVDPLVPKTCSFDCLYCEIGPTTCHTLKRRAYRPLEEIKKALYEKLAEPGLHFEVLTFAGSGEPTLHAQFGELVAYARKLTDRPLCLLTNSSLLFREDVRQEVQGIDIILPSLDAAREETFRRLNRPVPGLSVEKIIEGLACLRAEHPGEMWLEIMLVAGLNDQEEEIEALVEAVSHIKPHRVQLNTVDRPPAYSQARALPLKRLREIAARFSPPAEVISREALKAISSGRPVLREEILALLEHRPCPSEEIAQALGYDFRETLGVLEELVKEGLLRTKVHQRKVFYYVTD